MKSLTPSVTVIKPLARPVLIGAARRDKHSIVFRCTGIDSTQIDSMSRAGLDLARVRTPDEALAFINVYGPLNELPDGLLMLEDRVRGKTTLKRPIEVRERVDDVLRDAIEFREMLAVALDTRKAAGDDSAKRRFERFVRALGQDDSSSRVRQSREMWASQLIALAINESIAAARCSVQAIAPGQFEMQLLSSTLRGYCYISIARSLASREPLAVCEECARIYAREDGRQRFCEPKCAGKARSRRFMEKGSRDDKTTRQG